jgi:uncharacterized protein YndB with AHSA1/START domain
MTVLSSHKDTEALTLTFVAEFDAEPDRVWQVWEDPRQLERWWGPPTYPATFPKHDFTPGGRSSYYMTGPDGTQSWGWWRIVDLEKPRRLEFEDGFADDTGEPTGDLGITRGVVTFEDLGGRTRMTSVSTFESAEQLEQMIQMGMEEGMREGMGQIDAVLAESRV